MIDLDAQTYRCPEHGVTIAQWKKDSSARAGGRFTCRACARLNFRAWAIMHKAENRERARLWYARNRKRKILYAQERRRDLKLRKAEFQCQES